MTKHYTKEFRLQAARLVTEQGYSYAEVAQRLGPTSWSVRNWVRQFRQSGELPAPQNGLSSAEEFKQLRKENDRLRMENEILKKAAAYFAREVTR
jgi:transposase-like protein